MNEACTGMAENRLVLRGLSNEAKAGKKSFSLARGLDWRRPRLRRMILAMAP
jgi:hypothetical protein